MAMGTRKKFFIGVIGIAVAGLVWHMGFRQTELPNPQASKDKQGDIQYEKQLPDKVVSNPPIQNELNTKTIDEVLGADLADKFDEVAHAYEQTARYPANSQVVVDAELVAPRKPFEQSEVELTFPDGEGGALPVSLAAATEKFQYLDGEKITARVIVSGIEENEPINVSAVVVSPAVGELGEVSSLNSYAGSDNEFRAEFDSQLFAKKSVSDEMLVKFMVDVGDQSLVATVPFKYGTAAARLDSIPYSRAEGEYLLIPLQFTVFDSGYYFVDAILDDATSARPLIQLQTEGRMKSGNDVLILRAHQQALKDAGSQGPYTLRIRNAFRGAQANEVADTPVAIPSTGFGLPGVEFSEYADVQYSDAEIQQRIEFLRSLGNRE